MIRTRITLKSGEILDTVETFSALCGNIYFKYGSIITVYLNNIDYREINTMDITNIERV